MFSFNRLLLKAVTLLTIMMSAQVRAQDCSGVDSNHIACFTSIVPTAQTSNMLIPSESHRFQLIFKEGEAYTDGTPTAVPGNHDFTGYIPINGSSENGYLSVNHENAPGGVSIVDLNFNSTSLLWEVTEKRAVDFTLVSGTQRNCSGGLTPWGTVITAEELVANGTPLTHGANGWLVEIDPVTATIRDYGTGTPQKLWKCAHISHENACILNDSITLYTGEDGGTHAVYKFVADNKMDLTEGTLYGLKLDAPLDGNEPTGSTGTWIEIPTSTIEEENNTASAAEALGITAFNGIEDIEFHPLTGQIYFTAKGFSKVYRFTDNGATIADFESFVGGSSTEYSFMTKEGMQTESWGSGNDNLTFDDFGNLWVLQDGGRNYIWVVRPNHTKTDPKVELFSSMPSGSEPTGLTFSPDYRFGFFSVQHPSAANSAQQDASCNDVTLDASSTVVLARTFDLGTQVPVAGFSADMATINENGTVTFTDTSINTPTSVEWIFEGGAPATSTATTEDVTYASAGFYDVTLITANCAGTDTIVFENYVEVVDPSAAPAAAFTANVTEIVEGESVNFSDLSTNLPTTFDWSFIGGSPATSSAENPVITYSTAGTYDVQLIVSNANGADTIVQTDFITVAIPSTPPVADFSAQVTNVQLGDTVFFSDLSTEGPSSWTWSFIGGTPSVSTLQNPAVVYADTGMFDVQLIVENIDGRDTLIRSAYITAFNALPPVSDFLANDSAVKVGDTVRFTDISSFIPTTWDWSFSGAEPSSSILQNPVVVYTNPGVFRVRLFTTNEHGLGTTMIKEEFIQVRDANSAVKTVNQLDRPITIYPNPSAGWISLDIDGHVGEQLAIQLFDINGRFVAELATLEALDGKNTFSFDLSKYFEVVSQYVIVSVEVNGAVSQHVVQIAK